MIDPNDPNAVRIAALERALEIQKETADELRKLVEVRTRDLQFARERSKRQARLVGARTAIALLAQHGTLERAAPHMLQAFGQGLDWQVVQLLTPDPASQLMRCRFQWCGLEGKDVSPLASIAHARDVGLPGRVWTTAKPQWISDIPNTASFQRRSLAAGLGLKSAVGFPIIVEGEVHAIIEMFATELRELDDDLVATLGALGSQIGQWIEQARIHDQLRFNELQIARHIQTAILPRDLAVEALEVAAAMVPASEVGGDYYDVLPFPGGAWFGIGDVTGHGVGAGMIMLMVQSAVAALTRDRAVVSPRDVIIELNGFLYDNIRRRLREKDHVTFSLLRYTDDGVVRYAGAHEDIVVWRAETQRCETIRPPGVWLGAIPSVAPMTEELEFRLNPGDILVLYTDGLTEAMSASREQYGIKRLCAAVEQLAHPTRSIAQIQDTLLGQVIRWCANQVDDISIVVARYHGADAELEIVRDETVLQFDDI